MSSTSHPTEDASPDPATPKQSTVSKPGDDNAPKTPVDNPTGSDVRPKSAPATARPRSNSRRPAEAPTLLADFFRGRPSPARLAAERERKKSVDAVKAELRHAMRQGAVQRVPPPGGVRDRVKAWQKANAAAMVEGDPDDAATEPPDVAFKGEDFESVTEEDRVRIKMRQKKRKPKSESNKSQENVTDKATDEKATPEDETKTPDKTKKPHNETKDPSDKTSKPPPRKRVVSDEHWLKQRPRQRKVSPAYKRPVGPKPIPKDFLARTATKPPISNRIKSWAEKVEIPDTPPPRMYRSSIPRPKGARGPVTDDGDSVVHSDMGETASFISSSWVTQRSAKSTSAADDGIRIRAIRKKKLNDAGLRATPASDVSSATSRPASMRTARLRSKRTPNSQTKRSTAASTSRAPSPSPAGSDQIEVIEEPSELSKIEVIEEPSELSKIEVIEDMDERPHLIEVMEEIDSLLQTPTRRPSKVKRRSSGSRRKSSRPKSYHPDTSKSRKDDPWVDEDESNLDGKLSDSELLSTMISKSIADIPGEIPFGHSAFTELDLPLRGGPARSRPKRPKVDRNTSFKAMPKMLKKVMEEGKKIIHDINDPPKPPVANKPPSIEKWLNNTVDPFIEQQQSENGAKPNVALPPESDLGSETETESEREPQALSTSEPKPDSKPESDLKSEPEAEPKPEPVSKPEPTTEHKPEPKPEIRIENVDEPTPLKKQRSTEKGHTHEKKAARRRSSHESRRLRSSSSKSDNIGNDENTVPPPESTITEELEPGNGSSRQSTPKPEPKSSKRELRPQSSGQLRRSRATRGSISPVKSNSKLPFLGILKEAFTGESKSLPQPPKAYQSREERRYEDDREDSDYYDEDSELYGQDQSQLSSYLSSGYDSRLSGSRSPHHDDRYDAREPTTANTPNMAGPRMRPPTSGNELSTILSEENSSGLDSDLTSDLTDSTMTQSTITQSTVLTDSELSMSRSHRSQRSQRSQRSHRSRGSQRSQKSGLKRRLTKHSDLVSVLSLPDDRHIPTGIKSNRSRPSVRKARGGTNNVTVKDLLREFADDENLYQRELKTLVDGVIPVLLSQVVDEDTTNLFGPGSPGRRADGIAKSVVNMGVCLEKLKNAHRKAPLFDLRRLASWAHGVVPIYSKYFDAWRMGFQDLIVNLAPAAGVAEDEDSLLNAMPRNADGDVLDANGERIDVAHLLKRPLLRVKQLTKFMKCVDSIIATHESYDLARDFEQLQDKARRRHKEESARMVDEDAMNTDTTRSRDVRTLAPLEYVFIERDRQVSAKDFFSLDLAHSNGQRLECQVELVYRDNENQPKDEGDLLVRETGDGRRSYLLFPPIPMALVSARMGDNDFELVVMIRGTHNDRPWHELLYLSADHEDQVLDWLDILPVDPLPPMEPDPSVIGDADDQPLPRQGLADVPVGVRRSLREPPPPPTTEPPPPPSPTTPTTPTERSPSSRFQSRPPAPTTSPPPVPTSPSSHSLEDSLIPDDYWDIDLDDRTRSLDASMRPDPLKLQKNPDEKSLRDDGAPPPPVHRTFSPSPSPGPQPVSKSSLLKPPVDLHNSGGRVKRHGSSPLKHEYLPSEGSSLAATSITEESDRESTLDSAQESYHEYDHESDEDSITDSDSESSDDDIDSVDIPETELGFSIQPEAPPPVLESVVSSACSLTPSNSASQAGLYGKKTAPESNAVRYHATISRWSEKGAWKDISGTGCSVIVTPGLIEAYPFRVPGANGQNEKPTLALDLTPLVLIRQSTAVDLEIRSSVKPHCQLANVHGGGNFRFRCHNAPDCYNLYMSVHNARLNNQKFIQLENEARFKSFGERKAPVENDDTSSRRRRNWFGRKNSYRSSVRAPVQSHDGASTTPSSSLSASSFLKRLTRGGNLSFNLARSSVDRQSRASSYGNSLYSPSSGTGTPPRSPSVSVENSGHNSATFGTEDIRIRLHLLTAGAKWEDYGNCSLQVRQPPPGWHQALRANHGMEKRVTVSTKPRKKADASKIVLDAVLGSGCFTPMGSRGIVCGVWEEVKDDNGTVGVVPATGATGGNVKKWCFQFASPAEAGWVLRLVHQEVLRA